MKLVKKCSKKGIKVLSLFDGISCGMLALQRACINVEEYHAFEIDKYAVQVSEKNFPEIVQHGDVFDGDFTQFKDYDLLIGGSPCTYWSSARTSRSKHSRESTAFGLGWKLFNQYVRALQQAKPMYFIYENNYSISKEIKRSISEAFGFEPVLINSNLVSAQNRKRLYWVGKLNKLGVYEKCDIVQPEDMNISLQDILIYDEKVVGKYALSETPSRIKMWSNGENLSPKRDVCANITNAKKKVLLLLLDKIKPQTQDLLLIKGFAES